MSSDDKPEDRAADLPARVETVSVVPGAFAYPDTTQVSLATGFLPFGFYGSFVDLTFVDQLAAVQPDGSIKAQNAISARVRFDLELAKRLHRQLGILIQNLTTPTKDHVN